MHQVRRSLALVSTNFSLEFKSNTKFIGTESNYIYILRYLPQHLLSDDIIIILKKIVKSATRLIACCNVQYFWLDGIISRW